MFFRTGHLKRHWLGIVLIGMILLFAGGCSSSNQEDTTISPLDGTNNIACGRPFRHPG